MKKRIIGYLWLSFWLWWIVGSPLWAQTITNYGTQNFPGTANFSGTIKLPGNVSVTAVTGTGNIVLSNSPALTTPTGIVKGDVGLGNVSNTAFSGTLTIGNGSLTIGAAGQVSAVSNPTNLQTTNGTLALGGFGSITGALADGNIASAATWNAKQSALTFSTGLTNTSGTITVNAISLATSGSGGVTGVLPMANGGLGFNSLTLSYLAQFSAPLPDAARIDGFVSTLANAGLLADLVDAVFLRSGQNAITTGTVKSLRGQTVTLAGSPVLGARGMHFDGFAQSAKWVLPSTVTFCTIGGEYQGVYYGQTAGATPYSVGASASSSSWAIQLVSGTQAASVLRLSGTSYSNVPANGNPDWWASELTDPFVRTILYGGALSGGGTAPIRFVDGFRASGADPNGGIGHVNTTMNTAAIGGMIDTGTVTANFLGTVANGVVFDRALTQTETRTVETALRWLDPATVNVVINGDSNTALEPSATATPIPNNDSSTGWVWQLAQSPQYRNCRVYNMAQGGEGFTYAATETTDYEDKVQWRAPFGLVKQTIFIDVSGTNDLVTLSNMITGSMAYGYWQHLAAKSRRDGIDFYGATVPIPAAADTTHAGYVAAFNALLIADQATSGPHQALGVIRRDLLYPDPASAIDYAGNNIHVVPTAHLRLAHDVEAGINRTGTSSDCLTFRDLSDTYASMEAGALAFSAALHSKCVEYIPTANNGWTTDGGGFDTHGQVFINGGTGTSHATAGVPIVFTGRYGSAVRSNLIVTHRVYFDGEIFPGAPSGASNPNTTIRETLGKSSIANGPLAAKGYGWEIRNLSSSTNTGDLYAVAHDGTTLHSALVKSGFPINGQVAYLLGASIDGGVVTLWINGVPQATSLSGGPTDALNGTYLVYEVDNTGDSNGNALNFGTARVISDQATK